MRKGVGGRTKEKKKLVFFFPAVAVAPKHAALRKSSSPLSSASYILGIKGSSPE